MMSRPSKASSTDWTVQSLPIARWPEADRRAWIAASQPAERLKRGGAAAHLEPITRDDLARRYGYFLDFLARRGLLPKDAPAATAVTPENVDSYIAELNARVSSVTVYGSGIARPGASKPDMAGFQHGDAAASRRKVRPADHCKAPAWLFPGRSPHAHTRGEAPSPSLAPLGRPLPARAARGERLALRLFAHADLPPSRGRQRA